MRIDIDSMQIMDKSEQLIIRNCMNNTEFILNEIDIPSYTTKRKMLEAAIKAIRLILDCENI